MITDPELWEQASVVWETMPDAADHSPEERLWWQAGFVAGCKLFIARMDNRGHTTPEIRRLVGMDA